MTKFKRLEHDEKVFVTIELSQWDIDTMNSLDDWSRVKDQIIDQLLYVKDCSSVLRS